MIECKVEERRTVGRTRGDSEEGKSERQESEKRGGRRKARFEPV